MKNTFKKLEEGHYLEAYNHPSTPTEGDSILYEIPASEIPTNVNPSYKYWLRCFKCGITANCQLHQITISSEGLVTMSPSIACPRRTCKAHYYIENGEIRIA